MVNKKIISIFFAFVGIMLIFSQSKALINITSTFLNMLGNDIYNIGNLNSTGLLNNTGTIYASNINSTGNINGTINGNVNAYQLDINNTLNYPIQVLASNITLGNFDYIVEANATSGALFLTLPDATLNTGRTYLIRRIDNTTTNELLIIAQSGQTIAGVSNSSIDMQYDSLEVISDGTSKWLIIHNSNPDISYYRATGTTRNRWYTSATTGTAAGAATMVASTIYATPFNVPKTVFVDQMAIRVTTASGTNCHLGIYDDVNLYPNNLIINAGNVSSATTGVKTLGVNKVLVGNTLYWLVVSCDTTPALRGFAVATMIPLLGLDSGLGTAWGFQYNIPTATSGYTCCANFPVLFPASATISTAAPLPAVFVRLLS
jgi:hypothetical protein